jgi:hypothetical protein
MLITIIDWFVTILVVVTATSTNKEGLILCIGVGFVGQNNVVITQVDMSPVHRVSFSFKITSIRSSPTFILYVYVMHSTQCA